MMSAHATYRILADLRGCEPVELWRGPYCPSETAIASFAVEMSEDWNVWLEAPMRDAHAIGRVVNFDFNIRPKPIVVAAL